MHILLDVLQMTAIDLVTVISHCHTNESYLFRDSLYEVSRSTVVEGYPKAPFSIANTPRCRGERYSFSWIAPHTLDLYLKMQLSKEASTTIF